MNTTTEDVYWNVTDLDRTPVEDIERWQEAYDPKAAAELDRQLDEAFGPIGGAQ